MPTIEIKTNEDGVEIIEEIPDPVQPPTTTLVAEDRVKELLDKKDAIQAQLDAYTAEQTQIMADIDALLAKYQNAGLNVQAIITKVRPIKDPVEIIR